jgi:serine/threonine protein kinase
MWCSCGPITTVIGKVICSTDRKQVDNLPSLIGGIRRALSMTTRIGTRLGRYEIDAEVGGGAMGAVYRARDQQIDRLVAIKTIALIGQELDEDRGYRERFVLEARAAGRLSHPGIVTVFDVGEEAETGVPYIVMEYVAGRSLNKILAGNRKLPLGAALRLTQELAEALNYAHAQGVIHRDIKPANILVTTDGHAKIADFGIAKLNQAHLTLPGQVLGSPAYMAPEQLSGEGVDARSDLFSLGVILYTLLTGYRPFQGNSATTVCFKVVNHEPLPVTDLDSELPPELGIIVSRAMAKNPAERYQTGREMAADIQRLRESSRLRELEPGLPASMITGQDVSPIPPADSQEHAASNFKSGTAVTPFAPFGSRLARPALARSRHLSWKIIPVAAVLLLVMFVASRSSRRNGPQQIDVVSTKPPIANRDWGENLPPKTSPDAKLQIEIEHNFTKARASVSMDNQLVYTHVLRGSAKTRALLFRTTQGHQSQTVQLPAGNHQMTVRVRSVADGYDQSRTIATNLAPKAEGTLRITCDKKRQGLQITFRVQ